MLLLLSPRAHAATLDVYVTPGGDDHADGSMHHPMATLEAARDRLRNTPHPRGARMVLVGGTFWRSGPFNLTSEDSGISIVAQTRTSPRVVGGIKLGAADFSAVKDEAISARLAPEASGKVVWADLAKLGYGEVAPFPDLAERPPVAPELFFAGKRQTLARWPNDTWAEVPEVIESGPAPWRQYVSEKAPVFRYDGDRPSRWNAAGGIWLEGYWCFDWAIATVKVASIDAAKHEITLAAQPYYGLGSGNPAKRRFVALNVLEELDMPGEYCLDWGARRLYFWPPSALASEETVLSRATGAVVALDGCVNVELRGLTVEMGEDTGVEVHGGENVRIRECSIRNMGLQGVNIEGGSNHVVDGCNIYATGTGGLRMAGGDRKTLTPCGDRATNNHIYSVGRRQRTHADHVDLAGVGIYLGHNLLNDGPHQCIVIAGNDHVIEYNEIHHVGMESDDCGAFYMGRNPSERGNIVRYNFWHDIGGPYAHGSCAVYLDDGAGGQKIYGNVFYKAAGGNFGAIFVHGGHDSVAENNMFIDCKRPIGASPWDDKGWKEWVDGDLWKKALREDVDITSKVYVTKYPELAHFFSWEGTPRRNRATRNVFYHCTEPMNGNWDDVNNLTTNDDPGFKDAARGDFELKRNAGVLKAIPGFERLPFAAMGLRR